MAIFISYSRQDVRFVDSLVMNLVAARHHVWMDRWELGIGDSLTQRIQDTLTGSDAILVILSQNSVASECRAPNTLQQRIHVYSGYYQTRIRPDPKLPRDIRSGEIFWCAVAIQQLV
jgi:hypothetical protein